MGENNCVSNCGRVTLVILNIFFLIIGFVLLIVGILVFAYTPALEAVFSVGAEAFKNSVSGDAANVIFTADNLVGIVQTFAYILIGLGAFFFIIALLGIIGGCCKVKCVLFVYIILMVLLIVGQIALVVIIFSQRHVIDSSIKQPLLDMTVKYTGSAGSDGDTVTLNFLMVSLECCGINNYNDFKKISDGGKWNNTAYGSPLETPLVCCVKQDGSNTTCAESPGYQNSALNNADKGCYQALWNYIDTERDLAIGICSAIIILQAILLCFAIYIVYREAKSDQEGF